MSTRSAVVTGATSVPSLTPVSSDSLGSLLDLALGATAATGAALLVPSEDQLRVQQARGANSPAPDTLLALDGSVAGEAWYRARLVAGAEPSPRARQAGPWEEERTIDVMAVPVVVSSQPVAVIVLYHRHLGHFRRDDATTLTQLAAVAAGLWSQPDVPGPRPQPRSSLEVHAAARMAQVAGARPQESEAWNEVARTAALLLELSSARVSLLEGEYLVCHAATGRFAPDLGRRRLRDHGFEGVALESVEGVLASEWTADIPSTGSAWIRSIVSVPLCRLEQVIGVLTVAAEEPGRLDEGDRESLLRFSRQATAALVEVWLHAESERHGREGRIATRVAAALAAAEDTPALRRAIVAELRLALRADGARLSEEVQQQPAVTAVDGELPAHARLLEPGCRLLCGHELEPEEVSHRCVLPGEGGSLLAARLGRVTSHPGCLELVRRSSPFVPHEEELLRRLAEIAELALLSRLTNVRVSQFADRLRSVAEVSASLHQSLRPSDAMSCAAEVLRRALGVGTVRIGMVDEVLQEITFPIHRRGADNLDGSRRALGRGLLEEVWRTGRTYFFPGNAVEEAAVLGLSLDTSARCLAAVPLRMRGTITGVIAIEDESRDNAFEAEDVRILEIVARQLGVTLDNLESLEEERRQRITAEWLRQMARTATDPEATPLQILELAAGAAILGVGGTAAMVGLVTEEGTRTIVAARGRVPERFAETLPLAGSVTGWMLEEQGAVFISANLAEDPRLGPDQRARAGAMALAAVPIWCEGRIVAVLKLARDAGASFAIADVERLAQIGDHAGAGYQTVRA